MKEERLANQKRGVMELRKQKTRDSISMDMDSPYRAAKAFDFSIYGNKNSPNSGGQIEYEGKGKSIIASSNTPDSSIEKTLGKTRKANQIKKFKNLLGKNANTGANKKYKH